MNGKVAKRIHKEAIKMSKANWLEYFNAICQWSLSNRLRFAWRVIRGK